MSVFSDRPLEIVHIDHTLLEIECICPGFRTTETKFFNNLRGNTQIMKEVRLAKKYNNPKNLAVWELDELYDYFVNGYCYGVYDRKKHPALVSTKDDSENSKIGNCFLKHYFAVSFLKHNLAKAANSNFK